MLRLGYACINTELASPNRTCRLANATPERILELAQANLGALEKILAWNAAHQICLFRITSEVIPFGSHPVNELPWWELLSPELTRLGSFIQAHAMRVSMHPGQFTVLNSKRPEVVDSSIAELAYHARFLDALGLDSTHKIVLHLGGVYGEREASLERFVAHFERLSPAVARRLVLENDEKNYSLADALWVSRQVGAPVVFDVFHHTWLPSLQGLSLREQVNEAAQTWKLRDERLADERLADERLADERPADGRPKLHYSDPWPGKPPGSHSQTVDQEAFGRFYQQVQGLELDVMLEVKDKEQSVLKLYAAYPELSRACP